MPSIIAHRHIEPRRWSPASPRLAAGLGLLLGAATLFGAVLALIRETLPGVLVVGGMGASLWLAWQGAVHRGRRRVMAFLAAVTVVVGVLVLLAVTGLLLELLLIGAGASLSTAAVRLAFSANGPAAAPWIAAPAARGPVLLVNSHSGGGKAERFGLAAEARARGIQPVILEPGDDLATLTRRAVADGAEIIGMAGGDGSQATVAAIAADHGLPFVCVPAGTRNHFALDLGIDARDLAGALDAFTHGVERSVDLAEVNGRSFVNNVSLGIYARAVQAPGYREAKLRTLVEALSDEMASSAPSPLQLIDDLGRRHADAAVVLVSNNPYALGHRSADASRPDLDGGRLGIVVLERSGGIGRERVYDWSTPTFMVGASRLVPAGIDGEAVQLVPPVRFEIRPAALRVRIAAHHPGVSPSARRPAKASDTVPRLAQIAFGRRAA